ncbi:1,4-dihydroxy-2-naphthoyl-CoA synthase, peroxisomal [Camellia lanceoleosa]|nr:1,4-dihydroxy-2-naphthoyl-CoA synthase, peroxisomal [Camellia lanceoleosa]
MAENEINTMKRRLASVTNHIALMSISGSIGLCNRIASSSSCSSSINDRYHRIHGEVPTHDPVWRLVDCDDNGKEFTDMVYEKAVGEPIAKVQILSLFYFLGEYDFKTEIDDRNAFKNQNGIHGYWWRPALRSKDGYANYENFGRLNVLDLQVQIQRLPKPVIATVAGYAIGRGHILHMVCDLTIAVNNAFFGQTGPKHMLVLILGTLQVGSFDVGYGSSIMSRLVEPKKTCEMWFLARFYTVSKAKKMGLANIILEKVEQERTKWCREILRNNSTAIQVLKSALNVVDDGHFGLQELGGNAILMFYGTEEGNEGKTAYMKRRWLDFSKIPPMTIILCWVPPMK